MKTKKYVFCAGFLCYGSRVPRGARSLSPGIRRRLEEKFDWGTRSLRYLSLTETAAYLSWVKLCERLELTIGLVIPIVLMRWCIQEHQSKDIQIPHPIDAREEGTVHLHGDAAPLPMAFSHLWKKDSNIRLEPRRNITPTQEPTNTKTKSLLHMGKAKGHVSLHLLIWITLGRVNRGLTMVRHKVSGSRLVCTLESPGGKCLPKTAVHCYPEFKEVVFESNQYPKL